MSAGFRLYLETLVAGDEVQDRLTFGVSLLPVFVSSFPGFGRVGLLPRHGLLLAVLVGMLGGIGGHTFRYARGLSYLSDDPTACINCHIMNDAFDAWLNSSHQAVASCNDCHVTSGFPYNYISKAISGYDHSVGFTLQPARPDEPGQRPFFVEPIQIKARSQRIVEANCIRCHEDFVHEILGVGQSMDSLNCVACHRSVGHAAQR